MTQQEEGSDTDEDSSSDEDSEDEEETESQPAKAGVIEKLLLKNFMCHESFEITLGPQINFIVGRNGSGKSAILTGISVGLGARAADTSRGSSIKDLIKDGKETARVTITFKNEGDDAYRPEDFGKKIIIERTIRRGGTNSYFIKSENMKTISTKKIILDEIMHKFNITVDNPLAFLSQDKAREFLTSSSDHAKYEYFMAGSLIHDILENYRITSKNIVEVQGKLEQAKSHLNIADKSYKASVAIYNKFRKSDYLRKKLEIIHGKAYWFNVAVVEKKIKEYEDEKTKAENEIGTIDDKIKEIDNKLENSEEKTEQYTKKKQEVQTKVDGLKQQFQGTKENRENIKSMRKEMEKEVEKILQEKSEIKKKLTKNENEIREEHARIDRINGGSKEELAKSLATMKIRIESLNNERDKLRNEIANSSGTVNSEISHIQSEIRSAEENISTLRRRKMIIIESQKDRYAPWGQGMNIIMNRIKSTTSWHSEPLGPVGSYIEVKPEYAHWKSLLNVVLGKTLDSFIVSNEHDRKILDGIFKLQRVQKNIIIRNFEKFNFKQGKVDNQITILDMLNISDERILYSLVDVNNIEKQIITDDRREAPNLVRIRNVMSVYSLLGDRSGNRASATESGAFRMDPVHYRDDLHKFALGTAQNTNELDEIEINIQNEASKVSSLQRKLREVKMKIQNHEENLQRQIREMQNQSRDLSNEAYKIENLMNENGDVAKIDTLESQNKDFQEEIQRNELIISGLKSDIEGYRIQSSELKETLEKLMDELKASVLELDSASGELEAFVDSLEIMKDERRLLEANKDRRITAIAHYEEKIKKGKDKLEPLRETAESKCNREEIDLDLLRDTNESISKEYEETQQQIKEAEASLGRSYEDVQKELLENKKKRETAEKNVLSLNQTYRSLDNELNVRFNYLNTAILKNIGEAAMSFERSLALRGFKGELKFNFAEKTLVLLAQKKNDEDKRTVDSLSGGEKSFTQIALLLSIWKVMDSKIRGLDEFDVYMDSVNRSISIKLLLNELRQYPKSQSIFITPQDIASVGDLQSEDIKIHRMKAPRNDN